MIRQLIPLYVFLLSAFCLSFSARSQQQLDRYCRVGLSYQISQSYSWGKSKPVLISIYPGSPAAEAGLVPGDIVEKINGIPTSQMNARQIDELIKQNSDDLLMEVSNYRYKRRRLVVGRDCRSRSEFTEADIAKAFAHYSLEDESERRLVYPFRYAVDSTSSFESFKTFAFAVSRDGGSTVVIDRSIYKLVAELLVAKGLREDSYNPDVVIDCFYSIGVNPERSADYDEMLPKQTWRYDPATKGMLLTPLLPVGAPRSAASYLLSLGLRLLDARDTTRVLWECNAQELLSGPMTIAEYAQLSVPMMLMQFPFVRYYSRPVYTVAQHRHLYTGISYHASDPSLVFSVDYNSPASKAGILEGDRIMTINGQSLGQFTISALSDGYRAFLSHTLAYRDASTTFSDSRGLDNCRYWSPNHYDTLAKIFGGRKYSTPFAYLFYFRPYVNAEQLTSVVFEVANKFGRRSVIVPPIAIDNSYVSLY